MAEVIPTAPSQHTMFKIYLDPLKELNKYNYQIVPSVLVKMLVSHWEFLLYCLELKDIGEVRLNLIEDFLHQVAKEFCIFKPNPNDSK